MALLIERSRKGRLAPTRVSCEENGAAGNCDCGRVQNEGPLMAKDSRKKLIKQQMLKRRPRSF
jgi:hypothetical protein